MRTRLDPLQPMSLKKIRHNPGVGMLPQVVEVVGFPAGKEYRVK